MIPYKKLALAAAIGGYILGPNAAEASTVSYSLLPYANGNNRLPDGTGLPTGISPGSGPWALGVDYPSGTAPVPGYIGNLPATWYAVINGPGDSATVSTANMPSGMKIPALTVGASAYQDYTGANPTNWGHNADFGLFHLNADTTLTITMSGDGNLLSPGFSVWQGWDTTYGKVAAASRHGLWKNNGAPSLSPGAPNPSDPLLKNVQPFQYGTLGTFEGTAYNLTSGDSASLTLTLAAGNYSIVMGGISQKPNPNPPPAYLGGLGGAQARYIVSFTTVPIPAAVWLFGSSLAGLGLLGRRKKKSTE